MIIKLNKFGEMLISRPAGREAYLLAKAYLLTGELTEVVFDFEGVKVLTPSWMSEFINCLQEDFPNAKVEFLKSDNPSVVSTLKIVPLKILRGERDNSS